MHLTGLLAGVAILTSGAFGQVAFYENDLAGFHGAIDGVQLGVTEDFENHVADPGAIEVLPINPLSGGVANGSFTSGLKNDNLSILSIGGLEDLVLLTDGVLGNDTSVVGSNTNVDVTAIVSSTDLLAISVDLWKLNVNFSFEVEVYAAADVLLDSTVVDATEPTSLGIISLGHDIASVRIAGAGGPGSSSEYVDNISMYVVPGPGAGALLGMGASALMARRRRH